MSYSIGVLALNSELKREVVNLFSDDIDEGKIIVEVLNQDNWFEQGKDFEKRGVKLLVTRSGIFRDLKEYLSIPVISLTVNTLDVLKSLKDAAKTGKKVLFLKWDGIYFKYGEWQSFLNIDVTIERFEDVNEIKRILLEYIDHKDDYIVVGGGMGTKYAESFGFQSIFVNATKESIYQTISYAKESVEDLYKEHYKNSVLKAILDGVQDAVVAYDEKGKIVLFNERSAGLFQVDALEAMDQDISFISNELVERSLEEDGIFKFADKNLTFTHVPLNIDGEYNGGVYTIQDVTKLQKLEKKIRFQMNQKGLEAKYNLSDIVHESKVMKEALDKAWIIGKNDETALLYGESGTGKEMFAQGIHNASGRSVSPFVAVNCAAITESLLESELFGYEDGAFTGARKGGKPGLFELAHGGTIFLDEINSMSLETQSKLLRVIEEKEVMRLGSDYVIPLDVRIIAAANENLLEMVDRGSFRNDLFYRLTTLTLNIPSLRDRRDDILPIFKKILGDLGNDSYDMLSEEDKIKLLNHQWLGNVRELRNVAQRFSIFKEVSLDEISSREDLDSVSLDEINLKTIVKHFDKKLIEMLVESGYSKTEIARMLGISRGSVWNKIKD